MYKIPPTNENMRRPLAPIGSERAARLAAIMNLDSGRTTDAQDNLDLNPALVDSWPNTGGGITPAPPHMLATIGSERASQLEALGSLYPRQNSAENKVIKGPEATMYKTPAANDNKRRPQAAIGSERAARLAVKENLGPSQTKPPQHNLYLNLPQVDCWSNSGGRWTPAPPRALETIGSERVARLAALRNINPSQGTAARQFQSTLQPERVPHPDRNPLPTPTPKPTLTTGPDGLYLLLDKTPVQAESSWLSMLPEWKGKAESRPQPELPLPLYDKGLLDDLHYVQAKNNRLAGRVLSQMPNEHSRQRFQYELLRRQLRSEQQLTRFLEGMLGQVAAAPESPSLWMSWLGNGEDTVAAGGEGGGGLAPAKI